MWQMGHALFRLWGERCVGYFAVAMLRYRDQKRMKEEKVYFSWHFWRFYTEFIMVWEGTGRQQEPETD